VSGRGVVLGLNAFHADSAAALLLDGHFAVGVEEERLNRVRHWAGLPAGAVAAVLEGSGREPGQVEHVAVSRDPSAHLLAKLLFTLRRRPGLAALRSRLRNHRRIRGLEPQLRGAWRGQPFRARVHAVEHHRAHLASAFYGSPFEQAACLTVDGFGDFLSSLSAVGRGARLEPQDEVAFPHSLGLLYTAVTQFLGFTGYGDEYKVMGLAAYGEPTFLQALRALVTLRDDGGFETDPSFFVHTSEGVTMSWEGGEPRIGRLWSPRFEEVFGPPRRPEDEIADPQRDLAASLQAVYEEAFFHRLNALQRRTRLKALCLAGGCAFNSVANGKIFARTGFEDVFVQPAAGDAGTALGAAQYVWHQVLGQPRDFVMRHSYWGAAFEEPQLLAALERALPGFDRASGWRNGTLAVRRHARETELVRETAAALAEGRIVGWFQGRSEWGPRALGNRSILADPRRIEVREALNARIKRRESFRPFAPAILEERVGDYFEISYPDPFMAKVYPIRPARRAEIPAVTHVDGSGRLQTVAREQNPRFWALIHAFGERTGVPVLLNTSFNENEPIVNTPDEALDCFLRTGLDRLVLGDWVVERLDTESAARISGSGPGEAEPAGRPARRR
jgi:carbamoyltransferase